MISSAGKVCDSNADVECDHVTTKRGQRPTFDLSCGAWPEQSICHLGEIIGLRGFGSFPCIFVLNKVNLYVYISYLNIFASRSAT